jgi:hypothetical protein
MERSGDLLTCALLGFLGGGWRVEREGGCESLKMLGGFMERSDESMLDSSHPISCGFEICGRDMLFGYLSIHS